MQTGRISDTIRTRSIDRRCGKEFYKKSNGVEENCAIFSVTAASVIYGKAMVPILVQRLLWRAYAEGMDLRKKDMSVLAGAMLFPKETAESELRAYADLLGKEFLTEGLYLQDVQCHITETVRRPYISLTLTGARRNREQEQPKPGWHIVMTGAAGAAGTQLIAREKEQFLLERYPISYIRIAQELGNLCRYSSIPEMDDLQIAMVSAEEGGVFAALWKLAEKAGVGLRVDLKQIPIRQETVEVSNFYRLNPYELSAEGMLICGTPDGEALVNRLQAQGIPAVLCGTFTGSRDRIVQNEEETRYLTPGNRDELYSIFENE